MLLQRCSIKLLSHLMVLNVYIEMFSMKIFCTYSPDIHCQLAKCENVFLFFIYWVVCFTVFILCFFVLFLGAAGCALLQMRMTARQSGCVRVAAAAPPSGSTRPVCSAGSMKSSGATAQHVSPAHSAMQNTSLSSPSWVGYNTKYKTRASK